MRLFPLVIASIIMNDRGVVATAIITESPPFWRQDGPVRKVWDAADSVVIRVVGRGR